MSIQWINMLQKYFGTLENRYKPYNEFNQWDNVHFKCNSLGYRSEEFDPKSKKKIFVSGCSCTNGFGLRFEESWPQQFKKLLARHEKFKIEEINLLNFAVGGHSNDFIVRTLLTQCSILKPDLVLVYFTHINRAEYYDSKGPHNIRAVDVPDSMTNHINKCHSLDYLVYYTDEIGFMNLIKNMLLLQFFLKANNIHYIFSCMNIDLFNDKKYTTNPAFSSLIKLIDKKFLCDFKLDHLDYSFGSKIDVSTRKTIGHPGPKSNLVFAEKIFKFYKTLNP